MSNKHKIYKLMGILFSIDQIIKIIIRHNINELQEIVIIKNFFSLTYVNNSGAAFSILENSTLLLVLISVFNIILLNNYIKKEAEQFKKVEIISLGLLLGGIFGNLIDRIINRQVTDYLSFNIFNYGFPIFNFADICIVIGTLLLAISVLFTKEKKV